MNIETVCGPVRRTNNYEGILKTQKKNQSRNHIRGARFKRNHMCTVCFIINSIINEARCKRSVQIFFLISVYLNVKWDFWVTVL